MKQTKLYIVLFAVALSTFASCDKEELVGLWDRMEWKTDVPVKNDRVAVPAEGGTYRFECKNYWGLWISYVRADGEYVYRKSEEYHVITGEWYDVKAEGNVLEVVISPNEANHRHELKVSVQEGNAFYTFWFDQV